MVYIYINKTATNKPIYFKTKNEIMNTFQIPQNKTQPKMFVKRRLA